MRVWVHVVLIGMACSCVLSVGQGANLIPNGGFEVDEDGDGMADGWQFSGNASVRVKWSLDTGIEGRYSQRLECTAFEYTSPASHVMLALNDGFGLREGQWYRLTFQVKGEGVEGGIATVAIQQTGPWENLGLNKEFRLGSDWQEVEATFRATKTIMKNLRLQIWFTSTGTMWIDDVRMVETEPQARRCGEVVADWGTKNLLPNASFECGTSGWGSITDVPGWGGNLNSLLGEVKPEGRHHRHSFQIEVDRKTAPVYYFDYFEMIRQLVLRPLVANRGWVSVEPGMDYTLSADVRAQPVVPCLLRVYQAFGESLERRFEASEEWQRVSFTFKPTRDQVFVAVGPDLQESELAKATLWVDGVQLEKGTLPTTF
ncbi:MAG: carbohydrate binding domain-containing protein [Candidatus Zipacnadales bacterium]